MLIEALFQSPLYYFSVVLTVMVSIVLHELAHGWIAIWQGDDTPRVSGHLTIDPLVHMGPLSLVLLFVVGLAFGAMPVNPRNFRGRHGDAWVSLAGPAMNLLLFLLLCTIADLIAASGPLVETRYTFVKILELAAGLNLLLGLLNLLPVPPLDGSRIFASFSPGYRRFAANPLLSQYGVLIVLVIFINVSTPLWHFIDSAVDGMRNFLPFA